MKEEIIISPHELVEKANAPIINGKQAVKIADVLTNILNVGKEMEATSEAYVCETEADVEQAKLAIQVIDGSVKQVEELLGDAKREAHKRHKLFTDAERRVLESHKVAKSNFKMKVASWLHTEQERAMALQNQLNKQAAESVADGDIVPEVIVEAPKANGIRLRETWTASVVNIPMFLNALMADASLHGFVRFDEAAMAKAKSSYEGLAIPGVSFKKVIK